MGLIKRIAQDLSGQPPIQPGNPENPGEAEEAILKEFDAAAHRTFKALTALDIHGNTAADMIMERLNYLDFPET